MCVVSIFARTVSWIISLDIFKEIENLQNHRWNIHDRASVIADSLQPTENSQETNSSLIETNLLLGRPSFLRLRVSEESEHKSQVTVEGEGDFYTRDAFDRCPSTVKSVLPPADIENKTCKSIVSLPREEEVA